MMKEWYNDKIKVSKETSMVKLKDIAQAAGVSVTQVSRALNNHSDVSEDTKRKVKEIAKEMGYIKNTTAQKLVMQVSNQIALVIKGFTNPSNSVEYNSIYPLLCGINRYINEVDHELVVYMLQENTESYTEYFQSKGIQGAILFGFDYDDKKLHELLETNYPCVCIDIPIQGKNKGCVIINNTLYATQAVEALIVSGKKHIAMISGTPKAIVSIEREAGYRIALHKHNFTLQKGYICDGNFRQKRAKELTRELLQTYPEIDAFFCASDYMALGCMEMLREMGKSIPQDIAVIGFDNMPITKYVTPKLSTVSQNDEQKGYEAAKLLVDIMHRDIEDKTVILSCEIKLRESV